MKFFLGSLLVAVLLTACHTTPATTPLIVVEQAQPNFPAIALDRGESGTVIVRGWVDENGKIVHVIIQQSSGSRPLDSAALNAAKRTQFTPATHAGKPIKASFRRSYVFRFTPSVTSNSLSSLENLPQSK